MSTSAPVFRSSMSGFNKKDVNDYISKMSREFKTEIADRDDEIKQLKKALKDAEDALSKANESEVAAELEKANNLVAAQTDQLEAMQNKVTKLESELAEANTKLESFSGKMTQYDSMANRMGEIFMGASADADRIRTEAKEAADALLAKTESLCKARCELVEANLNELSAGRKAEISRLLNDAHKNITAVLEDFENKTAGLVGVKLNEVEAADRSGDINV